MRVQCAMWGHARRAEYTQAGCPPGSRQATAPHTLGMQPTNRLPITHKGLVVQAAMLANLKLASPPHSIAHGGWLQWEAACPEARLQMMGGRAVGGSWQAGSRMSGCMGRKAGGQAAGQPKDGPAAHAKTCCFCAHKPGGEGQTAPRWVSPQPAPACGGGGGGQRLAAVWAPPARLRRAAVPRRAEHGWCQPSSPALPSFAALQPHCGALACCAPAAAAA